MFNPGGLFQGLSFQFFQNSPLCDVSIYCPSSEVIRCHSGVLMAISPFFRSLFDVKSIIIRDGENSSIFNLSLPSVDGQSLRNFLTKIYSRLDHCYYYDEYEDVEADGTSISIPESLFNLAFSHRDLNNTNTTSTESEKDVLTEKDNYILAEECRIRKAFVLLERIGDDVVAESSEYESDGVASWENTELEEPENEIPCILCEEICESKRSLSFHVTQDHFQNSSESHLVIVNCTLCEKSFKSAKDFLQHAEYSHPNCEPVYCEQCGAKCKGPIMLRNHIRKRHVYNSPFYKSPNPPVSCDVCFKLNINEEWLKIHKTVLHPPNQGTPYQCSSCGISFPEERYLKDHEAVVHLMNEPQYCKVCHESFATADLLRYHTFFTHHQGSNPLIECHFCPKVCPSVKALKDHVTRVHIGGKFICDICGRRYSAKSLLNRHMKGSHLKNEAFVCNIKDCNMTFYVKDNLKRHQRMIHSEGYYPCPECGKIFRVNKYLSHHLKVVHAAEEDKKFKCQYCDKGFTLKVEQRKHEKIVHVENDRFRCGIENCDYSGATKAAVRSHHFHRHGIGDPPKNYEKADCPVCGKSFKDVYVRNRHVNYAHPPGDPKPYKCKFCGKGFRGDFQRNGHEMAIHIKEEPYECDECGKRFNRKPAMWKHQVKHHGAVSKRRQLKDKAIRFDGISQKNIDINNLIIESNSR